jgi:hypothetical protein
MTYPLRLLLLRISPLAVDPGRIERFDRRRNHIQSALHNANSSLHMSLDAPEIPGAQRTIGDRASIFARKPCALRSFRPERLAEKSEVRVATLDPILDCHITRSVFLLPGVNSMSGARSSRKAVRIASPGFGMYGCSKLRLWREGARACLAPLSPRRTTLGYGRNRVISHCPMRDPIAHRCSQGCSWTQAHQ